MVSLGIAMLVRDEIKALPGFFDNIYPFCQTFSIAVDDRTQDGSDKWLADNGYSFQHFTFKDNFSDPINMALDNLKTDWVLALAPDERVLQEDLNKIKALVDLSESKGIDAIFLPRKHWRDLGMTDEYTKPYPDWQLRLFKHSKGIRFAGKVHEMPKGYKKAQKTYEVHLHHFNMCPDIANIEWTHAKHQIYRDLEKK